MENLGEYIKREREKKGITLNEAAKATKIRKVYLQAIEDGNLEVQSPVFMKGFIRSYAEFLGIDASDVLERYKTLTEKRDVEKETVKPLPLINKRYIVSVIAISAIGLISIALFLTAKESFIAPRESPQPDITKTPSATNITTHQALIKEEPLKPLTSLRVATTSPIKPATITNQSTERLKKRYTLLVTAKELTWFRIIIDKGSPLEVLMKRGETRSWGADQRFIMLSGNAGGIELTFNGKPLGTMGERGKVATRVFPE